MQVKVLPMSRWKGNEQSLLVFAAEGQPSPMGWKGGEAALKKLMVQAREEGFTGKAGQVVALHPDGGEPARRVYLAGVGSLQGLTEDAFRRSAGAASRVAERASSKGLSAMFPERGDPAKIRRYAQAIVEGVMLAQYRYTAFKTVNDPAAKPVEHFVLLHGDDMAPKDVTAGAAQGEIFARAAMFARDLVNEPPSHLNPQVLAGKASRLGGRVRAKVYDAKTLERMGMGALAGVGRGSSHPPVFIHLHYQGSKPKARVALVGKGVTFDSGGLSLKGAEHMETMKCDMAGAATVMAVIQAADQMKLPLTIEAYIPAAENMPGPDAVKPGDVLKALNGRTIEVLNTDAEGRLILADALAYSLKDKPDHVIDFATLTGAVVVALGTGVTGVMGTDQELVQALIAAGETAGEPMWQLPLVKDYQDQLKSKVADYKNIGGRREAGSILGGLFLKEFTGAASWAHLDIAGTAFADKDGAYWPAGGTGNPVRSVLAYLHKLAG